MDDLLAALGWPRTAWSSARLVGAFVLTTMTVLTLVEHGSRLAGWSILTAHSVCWLLWFTWQGWIFPENRARDRRAGTPLAYRRAFYRDILPGVSFGVSQMLRPIAGVLFGVPSVVLPASAAVMGLSCAGLGALLLVLGFRTIGIAGAGFLHEYQHNAPRLARDSVYSAIRHPLFLGGVLASAGGSMLVGGVQAHAVAAINVAVLPVYAFLEDRRLTGVFGEQYVSYRQSVAAFIPRRLLRMARGDSPGK